MLVTSQLPIETFGYTAIFLTCTFAPHLKNGSATHDKHHSLHTSGFGSAGNKYFFSLFVKHMGPWICCVFHGNHRVHSACKTFFTQLPFPFLSFLKQGTSSS